LLLSLTWYYGVKWHFSISMEISISQIKSNKKE
jgi:hypothetical protein